MFLANIFYCNIGTACYYKDFESFLCIIRMYNHLCPFLFCKASFSIVGHSFWLRLAENAQTAKNNQNRKPEYQQTYKGLLDLQLTFALEPDMDKVR